MAADSFLRLTRDLISNGTLFPGQFHWRLTQRLLSAESGLEDLLAKETDAPKRMQLMELLGDIRNTAADIQVLLWADSVQVGLEKDLGPALVELAFEIQKQFGIVIAFEDDGQSKPLTYGVANTLYRTVLVLLMNIVEHSRADRAKITQKRRGNRLLIEVVDNGVGMDLNAMNRRASQGTSGLFGLPDRFRRFGGEVKIESLPGQGTRVTLKAPLWPEKE